MNQSAYSIMSDDDTESVSGNIYNDYYSDSDDSLPESIVRRFTNGSDSSDIDTDDESSDQDDFYQMDPRQHSLNL